MSNSDPQKAFEGRAASPASSAAMASSDQNSKIALDRVAPSTKIGGKLEKYGDQIKCDKMM